MMISGKESFYRGFVGFLGIYSPIMYISREN